MDIITYIYLSNDLYKHLLHIHVNSTEVLIHYCLVIVD